MGRRRRTKALARTVRRGRVRARLCPEEWRGKGAQICAGSKKKPIRLFARLADFVDVVRDDVPEG